MVLVRKYNDGELLAVTVAMFFFPSSPRPSSPRPFSFVLTARHGAVSSAAGVAASKAQCLAKEASEMAARKR